MRNPFSVHPAVTLLCGKISEMTWGNYTASKLYRAVEPLRQQATFREKILITRAENKAIANTADAKYQEVQRLIIGGTYAEDRYTIEKSHEHSTTTAARVFAAQRAANVYGVPLGPVELGQLSQAQFDSVYGANK